MNTSNSTHYERIQHNALKKLLFKIASLLVAIAVCYSIYSATSTYSSEIASLADTNLYMLAGILVLTIAYRIANANGWSIVLKALGQNIPAGKALRIWITSEACRWLPGSVWSYGSRAMQARNHGASTIGAGSSLVLELLLTIAAWTMTAAIGIYAYRLEFTDFLQKIPVEWATTACLGLVVIAFVALLASRRFSRKITGKIRQLFERIRLLANLRVDRGQTAIAGVYYFAMCLFNGFICSLVVNTIAPDANVPLLAIIGINATAWLVGFFAFLAPGGLVVREGAMAGLLAIWLPAEQALAVAIAWRILQIAAEVACMMATWIGTSLSRTHTNRQLAPTGIRLFHT